MNDERDEPDDDDDTDRTWVGLEPRVGRPRPRTRDAVQDDDEETDPTERSYRIGRSLAFLNPLRNRRS